MILEPKEIEFANDPTHPNIIQPSKLLSTINENTNKELYPNNYVCENAKDYIVNKARHCPSVGTVSI